MTSPPRPAEVRRHVQDALRSGSGALVRFTRHALSEAQADALTTVDCLAVLRAGVVDEAEWVNGGWRVSTRHACVVIEIDGDGGIVVVTTWRLHR